MAFRYENDEYIGKSLSEYGEWSNRGCFIKTIIKNNENIIEIGSNCCSFSKICIKWLCICNRTTISKLQTSIK